MIMKLFKRRGTASNWPDRMVLYSVLVTTKSLLENLSPEESFFGDELNDALETINQAIAFFHEPEINKIPKMLDILYAPTGSIQELSISNGWAKIYLELAEAFDKTSYTLNEKI